LLPFLWLLYQCLHSLLLAHFGSPRRRGRKSHWHHAQIVRWLEAKYFFAFDAFPLQSLDMGARAHFRGCWCCLGSLPTLRRPRDIYRVMVAFTFRHVISAAA
jgi:hypothetical protein